MAFHRSTNNRLADPTCKIVIAFDEMLPLVSPAVIPAATASLKDCITDWDVVGDVKAVVDTPCNTLSH